MDSGKSGAALLFLAARAAGEPGRDGPGGADGFALPAADALRMVDIRCHFHLHGAGRLALPAAHALVLVQAHLEKAETVKKGIESPQGAQVLTEGPMDQGRGSQDYRQHQGLPAEKGSGHLPEVRIGQQQGDAALQGSGGTEVLAEQGTMPASVTRTAGSRITSAASTPYFKYRAGRSRRRGTVRLGTGILCSRSWTSPKGHRRPQTALPKTTPKSMSVPST